MVKKLMVFRYIGDTSAFNPQMWANATLATLEEMAVISNLYNRDFENDFANKGDTVNTRRLGTFSGDRLEEAGTLAVETPTATNVQIKLDQHITAAFPITDRDNHRSFRELIPLYIVPAARAMVEQVDLIAQGEKYQFYKNQVAVDGALTYESTVDINKVLTNLNCPRENRWLVGGATFEADTLKTDKFITYDNTGDGSPLINGRLARGAGLTFAMSQMFNETSGDAYAEETAAVNNAGGYAKGATTIAVDGASAAPTAGEFLKINGYVYRLASTTIAAGSGNAVIESPGLHAAIADNDVVTFTTSGQVNYAGGYAVGHSDWISLDGTALTTDRFPEAGDGIAFGTAAEVYGVYKADSANNRVKLNRPLDAALSDNDRACPFPAGNYNFALRPGAVTLVQRSMALPVQGAGVAAAVANENGWALRSMMSYNHTGAGSFKTTFSFDCLMGVKTVDTNQGALLITQG